MNEPEIYCPHCTWRPLGTSRWICSHHMGGCGTRWNTFWTGGVCPDCGYRWEITACLSCKQFALHKDWYHWPESESHDGERERETEHPSLR
jgi:DNA-directed RNA polymerase subunit RPC12/RpoP